MSESEVPKKIEGAAPVEEPPEATAAPASSPAAPPSPVAEAPQGEPPITLEEFRAKFKNFRSRVVDAGLHRAADIVDGFLGVLEGKRKD